MNETTPFCKIDNFPREIPISTNNLFIYRLRIYDIDNYSNR